MRDITFKPYVVSQGGRHISVVRTFLLDDRKGFVFIDSFFLAKRGTSPRMNRTSGLAYRLMDRLNYDPKKNIYLQP